MELWFGESEVLAPANFLVVLGGVDEVEFASVTYIHIMFEHHEIVMSDECWSGSFQPGNLTLGAISAAVPSEIFVLFLELAEGNIAHTYPAARVSMNHRQAQVLLYH